MGRRIGALVMLVACNRGETKGADAKDRDAKDPVTKVAVTKAIDTKAIDTKAADAKAADAKAADAPDPVAPASAEISETRALVLADGKLLRVAPSGKTELVAEAPGTIECDDDDEHRVVWLVSGSEISAYDPSDGKVHLVAQGFKAQPDELAWQVQYQPPKAPYATKTAGNANSLMHCVALSITIGDKPTVRGEAIADGDNAWNCFEGDGDGGIAEGKLNAGEARLRRGYNKAKLVDPALLVALDARRTKDGPRARPELAAPAAPKAAVDPKRCEEDADRCGEAEYVGGSRLWWVVVSNSRGDFYHESRALYDATTAEFWDPPTGARSKTAPEGTEDKPLQASPDGTWGVYGEAILSLDDAKSIGAVAGRVCGWE